ncbi:MAG: PilZ domain-containing protein [Spirochaetaceae bacterium]|nr:PilZ domain-containing protein [Myxococcales bacterium]MCB9724833.1 PilZ domain-containing protein [Spirochaetaceae bacterium]HPG28183.1 PilZ domain-containing protein [Myxococcota bacterium]
MADAESNKRRILLEAGSLVILHPDGPAGGFPLVVSVDQVADGLHWFLGSCDPIGRGETVIVESPVIDDSRYLTRAVVKACSPATFALQLEPVWERVQQRAFVRISAHGLQVRVLRPSSHASPVAEAAESGGVPGPEPTQLGHVHDLLDLSAGGIRFQADLDYEQDEEVVCHFELPGSLCFVLPARVVRPPGEVTGRRKPSVAVEFVGLDENNRSQLLRWVYREQVRRHRQEQRRGARDRDDD